MKRKNNLIIQNLRNELEPIIQHPNCFTLEVKYILENFKTCGGEQKEAVDMLYELKQKYEKSEQINDSIDDVLDMVVGWCDESMRVWENTFFKCR